MSLTPALGPSIVVGNWGVVQPGSAPDSAEEIPGYTEAAPQEGR